MSKKKSKKNGSGKKKKDPKHPNNDPRTKRSKKQKAKIDKLALGNRKDSTPDHNPKDSYERRNRKKAKKAEEELREQERRARQNEPVVEPGNEIQNEVLATVPEGENRVEPPVLDLVDSPDSDIDVGPKSKPRQRLSSSSESGSDVDRRRKAERTPSPSGSDDDYERKAGGSSSQKSQSGESQSGSEDEESDSLSDRLREEAERDAMCLRLELDELEKTAPSVKIMRRYWENSKPGPLSSKPGMSKTIVERSTSKAIVEPSTSKAIVKPSTSGAIKRPRFEVQDLNLLCDSSSPKRRRVTRARMDEEEKARQAAEVLRKHKRQIEEPETLRVGKARNPNRPAKKVNSDHAKLNMQKKADAKRISESEAINRLYREVRIWNDGDPSHGSGNFQENPFPFTVKRSEIGVRTKFFKAKKVWEPIDIFLMMFSTPSTDGIYIDAIDRIVDSTNDYITENWPIERGQPPARKVGGRPEGARVGPTADVGGYVTRPELLSFLGLNFLMGYHRLPEIELYWEMKPDTGSGLGLFPQAMTRDRFKFITAHIAIASPAEIEENDRERDKNDPLGRIRWLIDNLNARFGNFRQSPRAQSIDESMVKFKGRSSIKQRMPNKPVKSGFKIFSRCDSEGYTYAFEIYQGQRESENHAAQAGRSAEETVFDMCFPLKGKGHIVAFDRFFSSIPLVDRLYDIGVNAVGTIKKSKADQPILFEKDLRKDQYVGRIGGKGPRKAIFMWHDTKTFRVISNYHGSDLVEVERRQKDGKKKMKTCPKAFADYGKYMGGVDTANQLRAYYERDRRVLKWWHRILFSLLETTIVNSWIIYKDLVKRNMAIGNKDGKPHELLHFKRSVTMSLLARGLNSERLRAGRIGRLAPKIHLSAQAKNKRRKSNLSVGKELRFENVGIHIPIFSSKRGRCEWCQSHRTRTVRVAEEGDERGLESRPFSKCQTCGVHLCLSKKRNCFKEFHDTKYCQPSNAEEPIYDSDSDSAQDDCAGEEDPQPYNSSSSSDSDDSFHCNDRNFRDDYDADRFVFEEN
jgi:hypothetical protein